MLGGSTAIFRSLPVHCAGLIDVSLHNTPLVVARVIRACRRSPAWVAHRAGSSGYFGPIEGGRGSMIDLESRIRNIPDFPIAGIQFKDITTLLADGPAFCSA